MFIGSGGNKEVSVRKKHNYWCSTSFCDRTPSTVNPPPFPGGHRQVFRMYRDLSVRPAVCQPSFVSVTLTSVAQKGRGSAWSMPVSCLPRTLPHVVEDIKMWMVVWCIHMRVRVLAVMICFLILLKHVFCCIFFLPPVSGKYVLSPSCCCFSCFKVILRQSVHLCRVSESWWHEHIHVDVTMAFVWQAYQWYTVHYQ